MKTIMIVIDGNYLVKGLHSVKTKFGSFPKLDGMINFFKQFVAINHNIAIEDCNVISTHFFRGQVSAMAANQQNKLYSDRVLADNLMGIGAQMHHLPVKKDLNGQESEKGIDVLLTVTTLQEVVAKKPDIIFFITGDGDYIPLVKAVQSYKTKVFIATFDSESENNITISNRHLVNICNSHIDMMAIITKYPKDMLYEVSNTTQEVSPQIKGIKSKVVNVKGASVFIAYPPNNVYYRNFSNMNLNIGDEVIFDYALHPDTGNPIAVNVIKVQ